MIRHWSVKRKLTLIAMTTSSVALVLSTLGFLIYDIVEFRKSMSEDLMIETRVIGANSTAALLFGDGKAAAEMLAALKARPSVTSAAIYDMDGKLLASYPKSERVPARLDDPASDAVSGFEGQFIRARWPIEIDNKRIGTIIIQSNTEDFNRRLLSY